MFALFKSMIEIILATILYLQVNIYRLESGLPYVPIGNAVCELTETRVSQIATDFSHDKFFEIAPKIGVWRENLATNFVDSTSVLIAWQQSKTHNEILLSEIDYMCVRKSGDKWVLNGVNL